MEPTLYYAVAFCSLEAVGFLVLAAALLRRTVCSCVVRSRWRLAAFSFVRRWYLELWPI